LTASGKIDDLGDIRTACRLRLSRRTREPRVASEHGAIFHVAVRSTGEAVPTAPGAVLKILADEFGIRLLLYEGGSIIFGQAIAAKLIDSGLI
jgi:riboflavin biosynthesis pyrimidine reductase